MIINDQDRAHFRLTTVIYALYALGFLTGGFTWLIAIIVNYVKKEDVAHSWVASHFRWQIRTFWFGLFWNTLGVLVGVIGVGFIIMTAAAVWIIYRITKGWLRLNDGRPMYEAKGV